MSKRALNLFSHKSGNKALPTGPWSRQAGGYSGAQLMSQQQGSRRPPLPYNAVGKYNMKHTCTPEPLYHNVRLT